MLNSTSTQLQTQHQTQLRTRHQLNFELDHQLNFISYPHSHHAHLRLRSSWIIHLHLPTGNFPRTHLEPQGPVLNLSSAKTPTNINLITASLHHLLSQPRPFSIPPRTLFYQPRQGPPPPLPGPNNSTILLPRPTNSSLSPPPPATFGKRPGPTYQPRQGTPPLLSAPPASDAPLPPLLSLSSTEESTGFFFLGCRQPARDKPPSQPALPSSLPQPPPHQNRSQSGRSDFVWAALLPHLAGSTSADRIDLVPLHHPRLWKTTWVDLSTLIAWTHPPTSPSSVVSPSVADPLPSSPWINHQTDADDTPLLFLGRRPERDQPPPSSQTSPSLDQSNNRFPGVFFA
ncbi:hypothetical protein PGT21_000326 [Puccinia graminis f. sp. tritici]|uniref:Uncharacterized protein n=1 Tax=Puccinia graminis f. sp. tritici TaxID=56615 RepID=A0A5B0M153_PUCGR|nr:hypothetical protein PGT21_000326 [Puccinia graminis f. sp. tritici]